MKRHWPSVTLLVVVLVVYARLLFAGFVAFDDDFQVYANPFLNPPSLQSVGRLWAHAYQQLYVPLAYTIWDAIASLSAVPAHADGALGQSVSLSPAQFHVASVALHLANAWLCFSLVDRLTGRRRMAWFCALLFALHPLQVESVAWVSELRGLASSLFVLLALDSLVRARQTGERGRAGALVGLSALLAGAAMLCKPSAAVLPAVALAVDRLVFHTTWRKGWPPPPP